MSLDKYNFNKNRKRKIKLRGRDCWKEQRKQNFRINNLMIQRVLYHHYWWAKKVENSEYSPKLWRSTSRKTMRANQIRQSDQNTKAKGGKGFKVLDWLKSPEEFWEIQVKVKRSIKIVWMWTKVWVPKRKNQILISRTFQWEGKNISRRKKFIRLNLQILLKRRFPKPKVSQLLEKRRWNSAKQKRRSR